MDFKKFCNLMLPVVLISLVMLLGGGDAKVLRRGHRKIDTVVVLMEENNSFDHVLGWFNELNPRIDGLKPSMCNPADINDPNGQQFCTSKKTNHSDFRGGGHGYFEALYQLYGVTTQKDITGHATNSGFASCWSPSVAPRLMAAFDPSILPVTKSLVENFAICDRCFASVPGPTQPNRMFLHSGQSYGQTGNPPDRMVQGFPQRSFFKVLQEHGISFKVYFSDLPSALEFRDVRQPRVLARFNPIGQFRRDAKRGRLPRYSFIEPRYFDFPFMQGNDNSFHDFRNGEQMVKYVYESLRNSPHWLRSLLIVTYDEHGGFFDHVPPPSVGIPSPNGMEGDVDGFRFDRLGVRVPVYIISPWIDKGAVIHDPINPPNATSIFDHTSVLATLRDVFGLSKTKSAYLTARDAWAPSFFPFLNRTFPRTDCPRTLPPSGMPPPLDSMQGALQPLTENQKSIFRLAMSLQGKQTPWNDAHAMTVELTVGEASEIVKGAIKEFLGPHVPTVRYLY